MARRDEIHPQAAAIGNRIAVLRDRRGLTNSAQGSRLGMAESSVKKLIAGEANVQFVKLAKLATVLGASADEILGLTGRLPIDRLGEAVTASCLSIGAPIELAETVTAEVLRILDERSLPIEGRYPRNAPKNRQAPPVNTDSL